MIKGEKNQNEIYLIVDRPLDKRFWNHWLIKSYSQIYGEPTDLVILQTTYVHDFLKKQRIISPPDRNIKLRTFESEEELIDFIELRVAASSLIFFYMWTGINNYLRLFKLIDDKVNDYFYIMHGAGDIALETIEPGDWFEKGINFCRKLLYLTKMKFQYRGPRLLLDVTEGRLLSQYPCSSKPFKFYSMPLGWRTKIKKTGNHVIEEIINFKRKENRLPLKNGKKILWLDQNLPNVNQFGYSFDMDSNKYYSGLSNLFKHFKSKGYEILFTLHPDTTEETKREKILPILSENALLSEKSSLEVTLEVDFVMTHDSTASYFAIYHDIPIINLYYRDQNDDYFNSSILAFNKAIGSPLVYFDNLSFDDFDLNTVSLDPIKYNHFKDKYINGEKNGVTPSNYMIDLIKNVIGN
jgi:hypothetical protein